LTADTVISETLPAPLAEFLADRIPRAAKNVHRRYPQVPEDDLAQAMWVKVLAGPRKFCQLWDQGRTGIIWEELRRAGSVAGREDDRYRRACRAAADGYSVYDIEFYTTGVLAVILPALAECGFDVSAAMEKASAGTDAAGVHIRSSDPFGGAENYLVILTDVAGAYARLPEGMRRLLATYYRASQEDTQDGRWEREGLASSMGLTGEALRQRVHRALQRLQHELGGDDPWTKLGHWY
jgi:hypothetical protein